MGEEIERRPAAGVVKTVADDEEIGLVSEDVFVEALVGCGFAAVGVAGADGGDYIGADADVIEGYGVSLDIGDEGGETGGPAAVRVAGPAAGGGGFAEGDEGTEFGRVIVFLH